MKLNKKVKMILSCILLIIVIIMMLYMNRKTISEMYEKDRISKYGEPIDINTGLINNKYFEISNDGTNADKTTKGINKAISYANKNNIEYIKLEKGTYLIKEVEGNYGILLESNISFDLNQSTIKLEANNSTNYAIIGIINKENVKIINGKIQGDREEHFYVGNLSHEFGYGIQISGGAYIEINNMEILEATGDGIIIGRREGTYNNKKYNMNSNHIIIKNNYIHNTRRQGITIVSGYDIEINNNIISDIEGTQPQSGICLQGYDVTHKIENIKIINNKFSDIKSTNAILAYEYVYSLEIKNNEMEAAGISIKNLDEIGKIEDNLLKNAGIYIYLTNQNPKIIIKKNQIQNGYMIIVNVKKMLIEENIITNGYIDIASSTLAIYNNKIINNDSKQMDYAYRYRINAPFLESNIVYAVDNKYQGNYKIPEMIIESEYLNVIKDIKKLKEYINNLNMTDI